MSSGVGRRDRRGPLGNYGIIDFGRTNVKVKLRGRHRLDRTIRIRDWTLT